ncbi:MAG: hypothetical protein IJ902_05810, partial [Prevotella sp.]|nr:hypothetical protein [Prevotella sp.]
MGIDAMGGKEKHFNSYNQTGGGSRCYAVTQLLFRQRSFITACEAYQLIDRADIPEQLHLPQRSFTYLYIYIYYIL